MQCPWTNRDSLTLHALIMSPDSVIASVPASCMAKQLQCFDCSAVGNMHAYAMYNL